MSREIKFAYTFGVDGNISTYHTEYFTLGDIEGGTHNFVLRELLILNPATSILYKRQYTGFKDETEKEIYDGDVLKLNDVNVTVFFNESMGAWDIEFPGGDSESMVGLDGWNPKGIKVIGNIYEHPHLLEK